PAYERFFVDRVCIEVAFVDQCLLSALRLLDVALVERFAGTRLALFAAGPGARSTGRTSNVRPTGASMLTNASRLNLLIFPFRRSETRGWVTWRRAAASACVQPSSLTRCSIAIMSRPRAVR